MEGSETNLQKRNSDDCQAGMEFSGSTSFGDGITASKCDGIRDVSGGFSGMRGENDGVFRSEICETTSGDGRAQGETMMLGACVGSWGLRDRIAHFATGLEGVFLG